MFEHPHDFRMDALCASMARVHRQSLSCSWSVQGFRDLLSLPTVKAIGVFEQHAVPSALKGFLCFQTAASMCDVLTLCVHPLYRRQGIGSEMMQRMFDLCERQKIDHYTLEVAQDNQNALRLYQRWGFTIQSIRPRYYRQSSGASISAYVMACFTTKADVPPYTRSFFNELSRSEAS